MAARINGIDVLSCYSSPNEPIANLLQDVVSCLRGRRSAMTRGLCSEIVARDLNAKSPVWGSAEADRRSDDLCELMAALVLFLVNKGSTPTFEDHYLSSVVDVTLVSPSLLLHVFGWSVFRHTENLRDHRYIVVGGRPQRADANSDPRISRVG